MKLYAKIIDQETGRVSVGSGNPDAFWKTILEKEEVPTEDGSGTEIRVQEKKLYIRDFYESMGLTEMEVEHGYDDNWYLAGKAPARVYTLEEYDRAMEEHIKAARVARGYTTREPDTYKDSSVPRWRQDALDYIAFRDECMLYGLEVMNSYAAGESIPDLDEFVKNLPQITWTYGADGSDGGE